MTAWARNLALFAVATLSLCGCKAAPPGAAETWVMEGVKHHLTVHNWKEKNPLAATRENIAAGKETFGHYCVACHGLDGQNTGVPFALKMSPPVPALSSPSVQQYTDGQLKYIIANGIWPSGMPASSGTLSDEEIWSTVLYIRDLPPPGSLGEPAMYQH